MTGKEHFEIFSSDFENKSDDEVISAFNKEAGDISQKGWGTARASFLAEIRNEFRKRNLDYSEIGNDKSLSFKSKIILKGKKIIIANN
jgi:hypothetical protein